MTPNCILTDSINGVHYHCSLYAGHMGNHSLVQDTRTNECGATHFILNERFDCNREMGHNGGHWHQNSAGRVTTWPQQVTYPAGKANGNTAYQQWFDDEWNRLLDLKETEPEEEQTYTVELTLADLKVIAYYLAEADEDDADTVTKIDEALKEAL